jgi:hypothetical protein
MDLAPDVNRLLAGFRDGLAQTGAVRQLRALHQEVARAGGPARRLHCLYVPDGMLTDPAVLHPYWFGDRFTQWQLKVITRAELAASGLPLFGDARPAGLGPVATADLQAAVHAEISGYWRRLASRRRPWLRDSWVDFGLITLPRAAAALASGDLITKSEAISRLGDFGVPAALALQVRRRRDGVSVRLSPAARTARAVQTRRIMLSGVRTLTGEPRSGLTWSASPARSRPEQQDPL